MGNEPSRLDGGRTDSVPTQQRGHHTQPPGDRRQRRKWRQRRRERQQQRRQQQRGQRRLGRLEQLESRQLMAVQVLAPLGQWELWEDGQDQVIDLREVFQSDIQQSLEFEVQGGDPALVDVVLDQWALRLHPEPQQSGQTELVVRAVGTLDGQQASDTLSVQITPVNDWPTLEMPLPELSISEDGSAQLDLAPYFADAEQDSASLQFTAAPFEVSAPGNPIRTVQIEGSVVTFQTVPDRFGYAKYAVRAVDDQGAQAAATLMVYVDGVNDAPHAGPLPDRFHSTSPGESPTLVALDLWDNRLVDESLIFFWDAEDQWYLDYSVSVDHSEVFDQQPSVDHNDFLLYRPTAAPGFQGSAIVTITARDREGLIAHRADGTLPSFVVHVDNSAEAVTNAVLDDADGPQTTESAGDPAADSSSDELASVPGPLSAATTESALAVDAEPTLPGAAEGATDDQSAAALLSYTAMDLVWPNLPQLPGAFPPLGPVLPGWVNPPLELPWPGTGFPEQPLPGDGDAPELPGFDPLDPNPDLPLPGEPLPDEPLPDEPLPDEPLPDEPLPGEEPPLDPDPDPLEPPEDGGALPDEPSDPELPDPLEPGADEPVDSWPPEPHAPVMDLDVLNYRVADSRETSPGALVSLNDDFNEGNCTTELLRVGPTQRPVTVLTRLRDNQPDRIPEEGRQHIIAASREIGWNWDAEGLVWDTTRDADLRPALVTSNVQGVVQLDAGDAAQLWVPAWSLYGREAFAESVPYWDGSARWIPVRSGESYRGTWVSGVIETSVALPVMVEGMMLGTSDIVATFEPDQDGSSLADTVTIHVVQADLDIDSDNNDGRQAPQRSEQEEQLEDELGVTGKLIDVNCDDADHDGIPDFADGYDLDASREFAYGSYADDDQVTDDRATGFVPLVIQLPDQVDPGALDCGSTMVMRILQTPPSPPMDDAMLDWARCDCGRSTSHSRAAVRPSMTRTLPGILYRPSLGAVRSRSRS